MSKDHEQELLNEQDVQIVPAAPPAVAVTQEQTAGASAKRSLLNWLSEENDSWQGTGKGQSLAGSLGVHAVVLILLAIMLSYVVPSFRLPSLTSQSPTLELVRPNLDVTAASPNPLPVVPPRDHGPTHIATATPPGQGKPKPLTLTIVPAVVLDHSPMRKPRAETTSPQWHPSPTAPIVEGTWLPKTFGDEPIEDHWGDDSTGGRSGSMRTTADGEDLIIEMSAEPGKYFDPNTVTAYTEFYKLRHYETKAIKARSHHDLAAYNRLHDKAKQTASKLLTLLQQHLAWLDLPENKQEPTQFVGDRSPSNTYSNMAYCYAILEKPDEAVKYVELFDKARPAGYTAPYTFFSIGTLLFQTGASDQAKALLQQTLTGGKREWNKWNSDPEYRIVTHEVLAGIADHQHDANGAASERERAAALLEHLPPDRVEFVRDKLFTMGIVPGNEVLSRVTVAKKR